MGPLLAYIMLMVQFDVIWPTQDLMLLIQEKIKPGNNLFFVFHDGG